MLRKLLWMVAVWNGAGDLSVVGYLYNPRNSACRCIRRVPFLSVLALHKWYNRRIVDAHCTECRNVDTSRRVRVLLSQPGLSGIFDTDHAYETKRGHIHCCKAGTIGGLNV